MGDNITPPQQAFNWIADVYSSTEEIKANGQTIVGLLHEDIGHLGIFVSGQGGEEGARADRRGAEVHPAAAAGPLRHGHRGAPRRATARSRYEVTLHERKVEDLRTLQKYDRVDEKPFEAVAALSELSERAYSLLARPFVREMAPEWLAKALRDFHPLRVQYWALSDKNPLLWPLPHVGGDGAGQPPAARRRQRLRQAREARARNASARRSTCIATCATRRRRRRSSRSTATCCRCRWPTSARRSAARRKFDPRVDSRRARGAGHDRRGQRHRGPRAHRDADQQGGRRPAPAVADADARARSCRRKARSRTCPRTSGAACCRRRRSSSSSSRSAPSGRCPSCCARPPNAGARTRCSTDRGARPASTTRQRTLVAELRALLPVAAARSARATKLRQGVAAAKRASHDAAPRARGRSRARSDAS